LNNNSRDSTVSICIPHWQVEPLLKICLRSIRKHSRAYNLEVIIVDNGSKDSSLDWLRSLSWVKLIERPEEGPHNFPANVFSAFQKGLEAASGDYFLIMHSDVFVKSDRWLDPFLREFELGGDKTAAVGGWKLSLEPPFYTAQKEFFGGVLDWLKSLLNSGRQRRQQDKRYPRDFCAMYSRRLLLEKGITFGSARGGGGRDTAHQIWDNGLNVRMIPVSELHQHIVHVAHGTAAIKAGEDFRLSRPKEQSKAERRVNRLFMQPWVQALKNDSSLDL
jgi:glycosyltransferase involved in cell wall biosynthesis